MINISIDIMGIIHMILTNGQGYANRSKAIRTN